MQSLAKRNRLTKELFLEYSRKQHEGRYNYDKTAIKDSKSQILVTCPEHGDFYVRSARAHYFDGVGCPDCTGYIKNDLDSFIERSKAIHGSKYDYSKSVYISSSKKLTVTCPVHGDFLITPSAHYGPKKAGCQKCSGKVKLTTETFVQRAREIFGHKYNYDKTHYVSSSKKLVITCNVHGDFEIRASDHMGGPKRGCPKCTKIKAGNRFTMDTELFIKKSKEAHGDKYDYSKSKYVGAKEKVVVTCPKHGDFEIRPSAHYGSNRQGCRDCGGRGSITTDSFIKRSKELFGERFEYSKVNYVNARTKVLITCREHGDFFVVASNHYKSNGGCLFCSGRGEITSESLVTRLKQNWGSKYDYTLVEYLGRHEPISVICPEHGIFKGLPQSLLKIQGCPHCNAYTKEDFIKVARGIHGDKYDYSQVNYISAKKEVSIICPKHGEFSQRANTHLSNRGCPTCGVEHNLLSNRDPNEPCELYYLTMSYKGHKFWKIGITTRGLKKRYHLIHRDNVKIIDSKSINTTVGKAIDAENRFIREFEEHLEYRGHILKYSKGGTETFSVDVLSLKGSLLEDFIL